MVNLGIGLAAAGKKVLLLDVDAHDDSSYFLLCSLEIVDEEGRLLRKADMFTKRTIRQRTYIKQVDTASEALAVSISTKARVDLPYMAELTGLTQEQLVQELRGVIFPNPEHLNEESAGNGTTSTKASP